MAQKATLYLGNDNELRVEGLKDTKTGSYINDATVTATLKDSVGANVTGATGLTLSYIAGSNGNYSGILSDTVALVAGTSYVLHYDATGGGLTFHVEEPVVARIRRG